MHGALLFSNNSEQTSGSHNIRGKLVAFRPLNTCKYLKIMNGLFLAVCTFLSVHAISCFLQTYQVAVSYVAVNGHLHGCADWF